MEQERKVREIDLIALAQKVFADWRQLAKFVVAAAVVGVVVALAIPKTYTSEVILAPEMSSGGLGLSDNLADMAANFGIDIGMKSSMDAIYPELYPDVFSSTDFIMRLFDIPVRLKKDNRERTYLTHIKKDYRYPFWTYPKMWLDELLKKKDGGAPKDSTADGYVITREEFELCESIRGNILCSIDKKTSVITISVTDQDPLVATILADTLQNRLQAYITNYRTNKARIDFEYYRDLASKVKKDYEETRRRYASMSDANTKIALKSIELALEDIENDMQLKFNTYTTLNGQLQAAKAKVQDRTPAFTIIQRPIMPHRASSTPRVFIVILFMILGGLADAVWVLYGDKIKAMRKKS